MRIHLGGTSGYREAKASVRKQKMLIMKAAK